MAGITPEGLAPDTSSPEHDRLVIKAIGPLALYHRAKKVPPLGRKAKAMLGYLALCEGASESRERLVGLIWSEADEERARGSLRQTLRELRSVFAMIGFEGFMADKKTIWLQDQSFSVDILNAIEDARKGEVSFELTGLTRPVDMLLQDVETVDPSYHQWVLARRHAILSKLSMVFEARLRDPESQDGVRQRAARALMALDPTHEEAARFIIRARAEANDVGGALTVYRALWNTLETDYDVEPSLETQELIARIKLDQPSGGQTPHAPLLEAPIVPVRQGGGTASPTTPIIEFEDFDLSGLRADIRYIAHGFRRDLIARMVRFREWRVREAPSGRGGTHAPIEGYDEYVVEASAFQAQDDVRLALLLKNRNSGIYHWSERITISPQTWVEALQGVLRRLAAVLNIHISAARLESLMGSGGQNATALDFWLQGQAACASWSQQDCQRAMSLFQASIAAYPDFAPAYSSMAQLQNSMHFWQPGAFRTEATEALALSYASEAVRLDAMDSRGHLCLGWANAMAGRHADAANHHAIACELNENDAWTLLSAALGAASRADFIHAHQWQNEAMRLTLSPGPAHWGYLAQIAFLSETYDLCAELGSRAQSLIPSSPAWLIAALGHLGRKTEAEQRVRAFLSDIEARWQGSEAPNALSITKWVLHLFPFAEARGWFAFREGLGKAGLPVAMVSSPYDQKQGLHAAID